MRPFIIVLLPLFLPCIVLCQHEQQQALAELFEMLSEQDPDRDWSNLSDELSFLAESKVDLNSEEMRQLSHYNLINPLQLESLLEHRKEHGPLLSIYELQSVPGWDIATIQLIRPFVRLRPSLDRPALSPGQWFRSGAHILNFFIGKRGPDPVGYRRDSASSPAYAGPNSTQYFQYRYHYGSALSFGLNLERDAGEPLDAGNLKLADHLGMHFYWSGFHPLVKAVAIGDYKLSLGQGLITHSGYSAGKGGHAAGVKKSGKLFRPHASKAEYGFFRGLALELQPSEKWRWGVFAFSQKLDATVIDSASVSSIRSGGLHRTASELESAGKLGYRGIGQRLQFEAKRFTLSLNYLHERFSKAIMPRQAPYNMHRFRSDQLHSFSIDYSFQKQNFHFFGELASNGNAEIAQLHGLLCAIGRKADLSLLFRSYPLAYHAINASAFGENSGATNETGLYASLGVEMLPGLELSAHLDAWKHPWLEFDSDIPSGGRSYGLRLQYKKRKKFSLYVRARQKIQTGSYNDPDHPFSSQGESISKSVRFHISWIPRPGVEWRSRCEGKWNTGIDSRSRGYYLAQDLIWKPMGTKWSFTGRYAIFHAPDYSSRIYAYENNLLYRGSISAYYGSGHKYYFNLRYRPESDLTVEVRYAQEYHRQRGGIGSGQDLVEGNMRREIAFQIRYRIRSG